MKYKPGSYKTYFFDKVGGKLPDATLDGTNYVESKTNAEYKILQDGEETSFVVMRIVYNSAAPVNKTWN